MRASADNQSSPPPAARPKIPTTGAAQALDDAWVLGIKSQSNDVHGLTCKGDRNLGAREVLHAVRSCSCGRTLLSPDFVVVGQGPQLDAVGMCPCGQGFGCECAVRHHGVAVQIGVQDGGAHKMNCRRGRAAKALAREAWANSAKAMPRKSASTCAMRGNSAGVLRPCAWPALRCLAVA